MTGNGHLGYRPGEEAPLVPLSLNMECCETEGNLSRNIARTLGMPYRRVNELLESQSGRINVCGFGPSLKKTFTRIEGDVLACNGAHDWLIEQGIIPKWAMFMDASPVMTKLVKPHKEVTYLVASRCHQDLFDLLDDYKVVVWHCAGDRDVLGMLEERGRKEPVVNGGTAGVTRGMVMARALGYTQAHLFGCDSSYEGEFTHVRKSVVDEKELSVWVDGRWFKTVPWMCGQVEDIKVLCPPLTELGMKFVFHGNGLLQYIAGTLGYEVQP